VLITDEIYSPSIQTENYLCTTQNCEWNNADKKFTTLCLKHIIHSDVNITTLTFIAIPVIVSGVAVPVTNDRFLCGYSGIFQKFSEPHSQDRVPKGQERGVLGEGAASLLPTN